MYFAESIPDRGDGHFINFQERHQSLLAEQAAGLHYFHVLVGTHGEVLGRVNLIDVANGSAEMGFGSRSESPGEDSPRLRSAGPALSLPPSTG